MSKCSNRTIAQTMGQSKIDELMQVFFTIMEDIDACAKINTKKFVDANTTIAQYDATLVPQDMIQICESFGCKNTGTLFLIADGDNQTTLSATFRKSVDATDFYGGVVYFYVNFLGYISDTPSNIKVSIGDIKNKGKDVYTTTIEHNGSFFYPVSIDLASVPSSVIDGGWTATKNGVEITIEADNNVLGISSISFFEDIADLEGNDTVVLGCLTGIDGTDSLSTLDEACSRASYDETSAEITRSITARRWSANIDKLNPFIRKTERTDGFFMNTKKFEVQFDMNNPNIEHGIVRIPNMSSDCGFVAVTSEDNCNVTDGAFSRVNSPNLMNLNTRQYQVINNKVNPNVDYEGSILYFPYDMIGKTVRISYPEVADATVYDATNNWLTGKRFKMTYPVMRDDGTMVNEIYHNVFPTSFPKSLTNSTTEFTFEISVKKDLEGRWYEEQVINKAEYQL